MNTFQGGGHEASEGRTDSNSNVSLRPSANHFSVYKLIIEINLKVKNLKILHTATIEVPPNLGGR